MRNIINLLTASWLAIPLVACDTAPNDSPPAPRTVRAHVKAPATAQTPLTEPDATANTETPASSRSPEFRATPTPVTIKTTPVIPPDTTRKAPVIHPKPTLRDQSRACSAAIRRTFRQIARREEAACRIMHTKLRSGAAIPGEHPTLRHDKQGRPELDPSMCRVSLDDGASAPIWTRKAHRRMARERDGYTMLDGMDTLWAFLRFTRYRHRIAKDDTLSVSYRFFMGDCREDHEMSGRATLRLATLEERKLPADTWHRRKGGVYLFHHNGLAMELRAQLRSGYPKDWGPAEPTLTTPLDWPFKLFTGPRQEQSPSTLYYKKYELPARRRLLKTLESCTGT